MDAKQEALYAAIRSGDLDQIKELVSEQPSLVDHPMQIDTYRKMVPITIALFADKPEVFELLLEFGANPNPVIDETNANESPLYQAIRNGDHSVSRLLLERGVSLEGLFNDYSAVNHLMVGIFRKDPSIIELLVEHRFSIPDFESVHGSILAKAFQLASGKKCLTRELIEFMVNNGASLDFPESGEYEIPLFMAVSYKLEHITTLLELGADPKQRDNRKRTLLHHVFNRYDHLPKRYLDQILRHGIDVNSLDKENKSALHVAADYDCLYGIKKMLEQGAEFDVKDGIGETPLHIAARRECTDVVRFLIEKGANLDICDNDNDTPLLSALKSGSKEIAKLLIKSGANPNIGDKRGITPVSYCRKRNGHVKILKMLIEHGAKNPEQGKTEDAGLSILPTSEPWAENLKSKIERQDEQTKASWVQYLMLCDTATQSKPTKTWLKKIDAQVALIGETNVNSVVSDCLPLLSKPRSDAENLSLYSEGNDSPWGYVGANERRWYSDEASTRLLKGLNWTMARYPNHAGKLRDVAATMFKKVRYIGMRNAKVANAALHALSSMDGDAGVKEIAILREQTKYNPALTHINRVFDRVAKERGVSAKALADMAVSDYGLQQVGQYQLQLGDFYARVSMVKVGKSELLWENANTGKPQKSVPAAVKRDFPDEVKELKALVKDLQKASSAQRLIMEKAYLENRSWKIAAWKERYLDHNLCAFLGRRLIWYFHKDKETGTIGIYSDGEIVDNRGEAIDLSMYERVFLWHPVYSDREEIEAWRTYIESNEIVQPFKQAHREIYLLTDAERETQDHSLRFAGHILSQHIVHALANDRGWSQTLGGSWDRDGEDAYRSVPQARISVVFSLSAMEDLDTSDHGIYFYVSSGDVRFYRKNSPLTIEQVPELVFSEIMRDVDLFVGVGSVGNDPEWAHRQDYGYWNEYSSGALSTTAQTRKETLEKLLPKLKIAKQAHIDGRYLVVKGKLNTYKIHLGSGNILMEPDNQYLCIVVKRSKGKAIYLPFEDDDGLSVILSKAFLLAADDKIKDQVIVSQITRKGDH